MDHDREKNAGAGEAARDAETPGSGAETPEPEELRRRVVEMIKTCYDPEIPVDVYELGLIYDIDVEEDGQVHIRMTLTSPMCPVAEILPGEVQHKVRGVPGVRDATIDLVWEPPWSPAMMSEAAKLELGF